MSSRNFVYLIRSTLGVALILAWVGGLPGQEPIDFAHEVLPILKSRCAECHANGVYKGGLSLETRDSLIESATVEIGSHQDSELINRITSRDPDEQMPPEGERLTEVQVNSIKRWIDTGLDWPGELTLKQPTFKRDLALRAATVNRDPAGHPLDQILDDYFRERDIQPPQPLPDSLFLRRAKLDLIGLLPTSEEIQTFAANPSPSKHAELIDELLGRERAYSDHWLSFWNDLLRNDYAGTGYIDGGRQQITEWLYRSLFENKPYDQFVSELINPAPESEGFIKGIKWRGRVNASQIEPLQFSQNISQVFLGINMKCASCHDSFIDDWKLADAYGLAAIISEEPLEMHRCDVPTGQVASSKFVFPEIGEIDQSLTRKERLNQLAELMISPANGRFPRTIVNRIWHRLAGRGLVHPVDVMANEAWSETLLDFLAQDLVDHDYDLKRTLRLIATSRIYRSHAVAPATSELDFEFRGIEVKRLTAEQFVDAVWNLTETAPSQMQATVFGHGEAATGKWIWADEKFQVVPANEVVTFKYEFDLKYKPNAAQAVITCDNEVTLFLNGKKIGRCDDWTKPVIVDLKNELGIGNNVLVAQAANGGQAPNPAALFSEINLAGQPGQPEIVIGSDESFQWAAGEIDPQSLPEDLEWQPAVVIGETTEVYQPAQAAIESAVARIRSRDPIEVRASLVVSDLLMRSLGRPNREQVVTTRPSQLSTLQALDLSNGEILTRWLNQGAATWLERSREHQWSERELVTKLFIDTLAREPTETELGLITPLNSDSASETDSVADLLWMLFMLPEFQLVR